MGTAIPMMTTAFTTIGVWRLGLPLPYTTVLLLLGRHGVSPKEQQHAMAQLAELQTVPPAAVSAWGH